MKTFNIILVFLLFTAKIFSQSAWIVSYTSSSYLNDIQFINDNTGWFTGNNGIILKTTNAGINWIVQTTTLPDHDNSAIGFINENTGWMTASPPGSNGPDWYAYLFYTVNGGDYWHPVPVGSIGGRVTSISAVNPTTVFFTSSVGFDWGFGYTYIGRINKTLNSGLNFNHYMFNDSSDCYFFKTQFVNQNTGWSYYSKFSNNGYALIKTNNQGVNWQSVNINGSMYMNYIYDICFLNENTGYTLLKDLSNVNILKKTTNGGDSWMNLQVPTAISTTSKIEFITPETGWITTSAGAISRTTNGGINWSSSSFTATPQNIHIRKMKFSNSMTGWILTLYSLYKTTTGGITFVNSSSSSLPDKFSLSQNYPNPFNPNTVISYQLPVVSNISLKIYDALGNEVETLVNEKQNAGNYSVDFNAASLPSGVYFYKLVTEKFSETKKMILIK